MARKSFTAHLTRVRSLAGVYAAMALQVAAIDETFPALLTGIGTLARVDEAMPSDVALAGESLRTDVTHERTLVGATPTATAAASVHSGRSVCRR